MGKLIEFIGRDREIEIFREMLRSSDSKKWILFLYDEAEKPEEKGGVGKTWLLGKLIKVAQEEFSDKYLVLDDIIDFYDSKNRNRLTVLKALCRQMQHKTGTDHLDSFWETVRKAGGEELGPLERVSQLRRIFEVYERCHNMVAQERKQKILRFYDTFEQIEHDLGYLMVGDVPFPMKGISKHGITVIAGRNKPDFRQLWWRGRASEIKLLPLRGFNAEETVKYFGVYSYLDPEDIGIAKIEAVYTLTQGRPILIALVVDLLNKRVKTIDEIINMRGSEFLGSLIRSVGDFKEPSDKAIVYMAHVYHRCDEELLQSLLGNNIDYHKLANGLRTLSFVRTKSPTQFVLHDEMRRLINEYWWKLHDPNGKIRRELSEKAVLYYDKKTVEAEDDSERDALIAERLWHKFFIDPEEGYNQFDQEFMRVILALRIRSAELLLAVADEFRDMIPSSWNVVTDTLHRGYVLVTQGRLKDAEEQINKGKKQLEELRMRERMDEVVNLLGFCYREQGDWVKAIDNYEQAAQYSRDLGKRKQLAETLNNLAMVYLLRGNLLWARQNCVSSVVIREQLLKQSEGEQEKRALGNSYYVMGMTLWRMGSTAEATKYFDKAYNLYQEIGDDVRMALVEKERGYIYLRSGLGTPEEILRHLENARTVLAARGMLSHWADALNMMGRVHYMRKNTPEETVKLSTQALQLAEEVGDSYRIAESHLTLCFAYYQMRNYEFVEMHYKEGSELAQKHHYILLQSFLDELMGHVAYDRGDMDTAFELYLRECELAARYWDIRFVRALDVVEERLLGLPTEDRIRYCDYLIDNWKLKKLHRKHPALVEMGRQLKDYA